MLGYCRCDLFTSNKSPLFFLHRPTPTRVYASILEFTMLSVAQGRFGGLQWHYGHDSDYNPTLLKKTRDSLRTPRVRVDQACTVDAAVP